MSNDDCQGRTSRARSERRFPNVPARRTVQRRRRRAVVVQNIIAATNKRIVSNVRVVWIIVPSGFQPAIKQAIATGMRAIQIGVQDGMLFFCGIIWYQLLFQVMIGIIAACWVIKWLVNGIQINAGRDRHQQQCHGQVARVSDKGDDNSRDDSPSSLTSFHDNNSDGAVFTSDDVDGSGQDEPSSDRPPENLLVVERKHAAEFG
jgi:hypothetical protein